MQHAREGHRTAPTVTGTFEYTFSYLIDHELDSSVFDQRYNNEDAGRPAYDPALLLKIVLYACARGIVSSRRIVRCCRENVIVMVLSVDTQPHGGRDWRAVTPRARLPAARSA